MSRPQNPEYADPVIREPSPASSVGTVYGLDQTTLSDDELDQWAFERKWEEKLGLRRITKEEEMAERDPLLPRPSTATDERAQFDQTLRNLRMKVEELEESELYEQTMLRGSQAAVEEETVPKDIDLLMLSLMGGGSSRAAGSNSANNTTVTDGPWNQSRNRYEGGATQKRTKGKGRSRK
ncbi:hypothetical protein MSAN_01782400 [Mycena sanguinolenta]|uniref:Uncharacterized protein n=1 Tax=Mycena sanguinolenta TaxID=230812 RepID=A0A8H6XW79_9AGAR|nr:hypothetical protein MSAN_01782400 [Mycena sanguinolenta]